MCARPKEPHLAYPRPTRWIILSTLAIVTAACSASPSARPSSIVVASAGASAAASAAASPTAAATPMVTPAPAAWAVTDMPFPDRATACVPADGGLQNLQVVGFGTGVLALGSCAHSASPSLVWVSADGRSWQASAPAALAHADVYQLLVSDGLVIATGQDVTDGATAAAWTSRDGLSWTHSTGDLGCGVMSSVARFGSTFVAFGNRVPEIPEFEVPPGVCEWLSADGFTWTRVSLPKTVFPDHTAVSSVSAGPVGLIAVGEDSGPDHSIGALWRSSDGRAWTRVASPWAADWSSIDVALPLGPGFVVLGTDSHGNKELATSVDGAAWTPAPAPGQGTLNGAPALAAGPAGVIFCGILINGAPSPTVAWTSSDGSNWLPAPTLPPEFPTAPDGLAYHSVAVVAGAFVVGASTADGGAVIVTLKP
jgi:hypothetical protein